LESNLRGKKEKKRKGAGENTILTLLELKKKKKRQQALVFSLSFCEHWGEKNSSSKRNPTNLAHDIIL